MTIEIVKGVIRKDKKEYGKGDKVDMDDKEAASLIALGMAKKAGGNSSAPPAASGEAKKGGEK